MTQKLSQEQKMLKTWDKQQSQLFQNKNKISKNCAKCAYENVVVVKVLREYISIVKPVPLVTVYISGNEGPLTRS